ncbi:MAG TPA: hybrid sensor histidine kinase/response regulator [Planctomycetaceae bacterium]|nr:hybrid sensor histidine kinase/response regulator [Planctomycetaceae bacterium]HRF00270.1 chemotaxis protein CheW [Pirellulaceae bacterium]
MAFEDAELIAAFVVESLEHLADVENQLLSIESGGAEIDIELVNTVFRAVHSVKGAAGFLGLQTINRLSHSLENVLNRVRNRELVPDSAIVDVLLKGADQLRQLLQQVERSNSVDVTSHVVKLDRIADGSWRSAEADDTEPTATASEVTSVPAVAAPRPAAPSPIPTVASTSPSAAAPVAVPTVDDDAPVSSRGDDASGSAKRADGNAAASDLNIRVPVTVLDRLMNLAGELVLSRNQLLQTMGTPDRIGLESAAAGLDQVTSELQEAIMQTRMQPIGTVFGKFPRIVRDLSAKLGKQCNLTIEGREVEVDKTIIEAISDPLTHLIRNSVDHGLESPSARQAKGKKAAGTLTLRAFHQAGKVRIDIQDDGAGINPSVIKAKAIEKQLITPEQAMTMGDREAIRLIFAPGFSTAAAVTDVSGRGVGMDVVRTNIERLGGNVDIESAVGQGTTIRITLPLTLAIIPSMIVQSGEFRYALPQVNIVELVRVRSEEIASRIARIKSYDMLRLRGSLLPLVHLRQILGAPRDSADADRPLHVVVVEAGQFRYGLVVDALHDSEEIVVKPLGRHVKQCGYVAGATILGDGRVALIIDVAGVATECRLKSGDSDETSYEEVVEADASDTLQTLLLFANHPSEQFAIPMGLVSRIERVLSEQIDAVGGRELLQFRGQSLPLLRVDRLVTAKPPEASERSYVVVFDIRGREVGLVVPILDDIRRVSGTVDTVTFHEPGIAGSIVIDKRTTRIVDLYELARLSNKDWFATEEQETRRRKVERPRVMLAEDSMFFQRQVAGFLENAGYDVVTADDGQHAWEQLLDGTQVLLVITDIEMPRMNGLELCRAIKSHATLRSLPVIALTSLAGSEDIQRGYESGVCDYQVKMDREKLIASVRNQLQIIGAASAEQGVPA